ncbi:hypothetical protein HPB48_025056 [Haemaphysalis longicornis]|uniref:Uncharacterized protein n=1 Tax=Haemaphysalis longicornis TaxID=44386 RepID=A0A9J6GYK2_HAELO|nr:hypothetical protein HPB48_025056 [Haemaphysalis longicornis]
MVDYCYNCGGSNPDRWLPRMPYEMLFVVGGWCEGHARAALEAYDPCANRWLVHPNPGFEARAYHGVVMFRKKLYVVGGLRQRAYLRTLDCFDTERCVWVQCSPMHVARAYVSVVQLGEHIYAIGGHTGTHPLFQTSQNTALTPHCGLFDLIDWPWEKEVLFTNEKK